MPTPCPYCQNPGPHQRLVDHPDEEMAHLVPLVCAGCGREFSHDTLPDVPVEIVTDPAGDPQQ